MMYFLSVLVGISLLIWGLLMSLQATSAINKTLKSFKALKEDTYFLELSKLREELDELNYSYYEILNDLTTRLDATESFLHNRIQKDAVDKSTEVLVESVNPGESYKGLHNTVEPLPFMLQEQTISRERLDAQRRETIKKLIAQGLTDQEIARSLGVGIGEVGVLRRTGASR